MLVVRCKDCNKEITSNTKTQVCGCPNMMTVRDDSVTAVDLSKVVMLNSSKKEQKKNVLSLRMFNGKNREENVKFVN